MVGIGREVEINLSANCLVLFEVQSFTLKWQFDH